MTTPNELTIRLENERTYRHARCKAQALRNGLVEAFPEVDPVYNQPRGKFIRISVDRDEEPDGTIKSIEYTIKIDFHRLTLQEFLKIASVVEKYFPEYKG